MARPLRIELADGYYHVMNRGNNRQDIFLSDKDRIAFMEALAASCEIHDVHLMAYVLMTNHFSPAGSHRPGESERIYAPFSGDLYGAL